MPRVGNNPGTEKEGPLGKFEKLRKTKKIKIPLFVF